MIDPIHVALDLLSVSIGVAIAVLARRHRFYGRGPNANLFIAFFGVSVAVLDILHIVVPMSGLVADMEFFSPMSWLAAKVPLPILVSMLCVSPPSVPKHSFGVLFSFVVGMCLLVPGSTQYYYEGAIGRPYDLLLLPLIGACLWRIRKYPRDLMTMACWASMLLMIAQQLIMACSQKLYDAPFQMAHIVHSLSLIPILLLTMNGVHSILDFESEGRNG